MAAQTPEQTHELFVNYFNSADIDSLVSMYEPNATLFSLDAPPAQGRAAIREAITGFLAGKGHMRLVVDKVMKADDIAILFSSWTLKGTGPDGNPLETAGQTSDVVRRQPDGSWMFVIDNPHGALTAR
jgi:ketosteroid isomerase-like protein